MKYLQHLFYKKYLLLCENVHTDTGIRVFENKNVYYISNVLPNISFKYVF